MSWKLNSRSHSPHGKTSAPKGFQSLIPFCPSSPMTEQKFTSKIAPSQKDLKFLKKECVASKGDMHANNDGDNEEPEIVCLTPKKQTCIENYFRKAIKSELFNQENEVNNAIGQSENNNTSSSVSRDLSSLFRSVGEVNSEASMPTVTDRSSSDSVVKDNLVREKWLAGMVSSTFKQIRNCKNLMTATLESGLSQNSTDLEFLPCHQSRSTSPAVPPSSFGKTSDDLVEFIVKKFSTTDLSKLVSEVYAETLEKSLVNNCKTDGSTIVSNPNSDPTEKFETLMPESPILSRDSGSRITYVLKNPKEGTDSFLHRPDGNNCTNSAFSDDDRKFYASENSDSPTNSFLTSQTFGDIESDNSPNLENVEGKTDLQQVQKRVEGPSLFPSPIIISDSDEESDYSSTLPRPSDSENSETSDTSDLDLKKTNKRTKTSKEEVIILDSEGSSTDEATCGSMSSVQKASSSKDSDTTDHCLSPVPYEVIELSSEDDEDFTSLSVMLSSGNKTETSLDIEDRAFSDTEKTEMNDSLGIPQNWHLGKSETLLKNSKLKFHDLVAEAARKQKLISCYKTLHLKEPVSISEQKKLAEGEDVSFSLMKDQNLNLEGLSVQENRIQQQPPGLNIVNHNVSYMLFGSCHDISLTECGFEKGSEENPVIQRLLLASSHLLPTILSHSSVRTWMKVPSQNNRAAITYMLKIASLKESHNIFFDLKHALNDICCENASNENKQLLCPPLDEVLKIFCNLGILVYDHCPLFERFANAYKQYQGLLQNKLVSNKENKLSGPKHIDVSNDECHGIIRLIELLTLLLRSTCCAYSDSDLIDLILMVSWLSLDQQMLAIESSTHLVENCILEALELISDADWLQTLHCLALSMCRFESHHHRFVHLAHLMPSTPRGNQLQRLFSFVALQKLLEIEDYETSLHLSFEVTPQSVLSILTSSSVLGKQDPYSLHSVLSLIDIAVGNSVSSEQLEFLQQLGEAITCKIPHMKETVKCLEKTFVKNSIYFLRSKWTIIASSIPHKQKRLFASRDHRLNVDLIQDCSASDTEESLSPDEDMEMD